MTFMLCIYTHARVYVHLSKHTQVIRARVPLIAFVDAQSGVAVDISVCNHGGTFKSLFTRELSQFDPRFVSLYRLVRQLLAVWLIGIARQTDVRGYWWRLFLCALLFARADYTVHCLLSGALCMWQRLQDACISTTLQGCRNSTQQGPS